MEILMRWLIASLLLCSLAPLSLAADDTPALINEALDKPVAKLEVNGVFEVPLDELRTAWTATLPAALG